MLLVKPNNKYSHCYFLRYVPGLMLLIILFMFHTVEQNVIILMSHRLVYFVSFCVTKLHKGKEDSMGFGRGWGVLKRSISDRLQISFPQGRIFYKELESLLCPQLV